MAKHEERPQKRSRHSMTTRSSSTKIEHQKTLFTHLPELPLEILDMLIPALTDADLYSTRRTCRRLLNATSLEFYKRFLRQIKVLGKAADIRALTEILESPNFSSSRNAGRELTILKPHRKDMSRSFNLLKPTPDNTRDEEGTWIGINTMPSRKDMARLLEAMPNLQAFSYDRNGPKDVIRNKILIRNQDIMDSVLHRTCRRLKYNTLTSLTLSSCVVNVGHLLYVLEDNADSLRTVKLVDVKGRFFEWWVVFDVLLDAKKLDKLTIDGIGENTHACLKKQVLLKESPSDNHLWTTVDPMAGWIGAPVQREAEMVYFTRFSAYLSREWVKKGLEVLLGKENWALYPSYPVLYGSANQPVNGYLDI